MSLQLVYNQVNHSVVKTTDLFIYSKTSNNRPSEERTTSLQQTDHLPPFDFTIELGECSELWGERERVA